MSVFELSAIYGISFPVTSNNYGQMLEQMGYNQNWFNQQNGNTYPWNINNIPQQGGSQQGGTGSGDTQPAGGDTQPASGEAGEIIEFHEDSGLVEGGARDDYIYKAGVSYYDFDKALADMSKVIRDDSKEQLEDFLQRFETDQDLKSVIELGENSPVFDDVDEETAIKFANAVKAVKDFAEASLAYEADGKGTKFADYLREKGLGYAKKANELEGKVLTYGENYYGGQANDVVGDRFAAAKKMKAFKKAGTVGNIISGALAVGDLGLTYAAYSEAAEFYDKKRQGIIENMSEENMAESLKQLEAYEKARGNAGAKVVASCVDAVVIVLSMGINALGTTAGAAVGSIVEPGGGTAVGALIGGELTNFIIVKPIEWLKNKWKNAYLNGDHPYAGNIPTWNEITGKNIQSSNAIPEVATTTVNGAAGNDALVNKGELVLMTGGAGNDSLVNHGNKVTLQGDGGSNYISNMGDGVSIIGGADNDLIVNHGNQITINANAGDDYVANNSDNVTISATTGDNTITSAAGKNVSVVAGGGNDSIVNAMGSDIKISAGDGNNVLENYGGENVLLEAGKDDDLFDNYGDNTTVNAGSGKNVIYHSYGSNGLINAGNDADFVFVQESAGGVTVNVGGGADTVFNNGVNALVNVGADNNFISNGSLGGGATLVGLGGNDTLENRAANVSINGGSGNNRIVNDGTSVTMTGGDGADAIVNAGDKALINAGNGTNSVGNAGDTVSVFTGNEADTILNEGSNVTINVAGGNDAVTNKGSAVSIIAESGNNSINNYGNDVNVSGGTGNDKIMNGNSDVTLNGNKGADVFVNYFAVQVDDNYDITALLYNGTDVLINGGDDNDHLENEGGEATLLGGAGADIIINNGIFVVDKNNDHLGYSAANGSYLIDGESGNDYIYNMNSGATIRGGEGNDTIELAETAANNVIMYKAGDGDDTIYGYNSTTTIKVSDADPNMTWQGTDVIVRIGDGKITLKDVPVGSGLNVIREDEPDTKLITGTEGADTIDNTLDDATISALGGNDRITNSGASVLAMGDSGNDTIENTAYGTYDYTTSKWSVIGTPNDVTLDGGSGADSIANYGGARVSIDGGADNDYITNNTKPCDPPIPDTYVPEEPPALNVYESDVYDDVVYEDKQSSEEETPASVYSPDDATLNGGFGNDTIYNEGASAVINGDAGNDYIENTGDSATIAGGDGADTIRNEGDYFHGWKNGGNAFISGGDGNDSIYNQEADKVTISAGAGNDSITNIASNVSINGGDNNDYIFNGVIYGYSNEAFTISPDNVTIDGGNGDDTIKNFGDNVLINGGAGNDSISNIDYLNWNDDIIASPENVTINAGEGDDTITGSDNAEVILVASNHGNDVITNFGKNDTIKCMAGSIATVQTVGDDAVVSLTNANYSGTVRLLGAGDYRFVYNSSVLTVDSSDAIINEANGVKVVGTSNADSIVNGGSNVTIQGNEGDDTITGSDNGELILVASNHGNDLITNFGENDTLRCTAGKIATVRTVGDDAVVSLKGAAYSGTVTLQGAGDYSFDWTSAYLKMKSSDAIVNTLDGVKVVGTSSADSIVNSGSGVTIQGNAGDDTITGSDNGELILVASNHGNDLITNFGENDTLRCTAGKIATVRTVGDDAVVSLKGSAYSGTVTLQGAGDYRFVYNSSVLTVDSSDAIINEANGVKVVGTSSADSIVNSGSGVTIQGNAGDDTITGSDNGELILVASNHGNDLITNFGENDTLRCTAGKIATVQTVDDDAVVSLKGAAYSGTVTLQGAGDYSFDWTSAYLKMKSSDAIVNTLDGVKVVGTSSADSIVNSGSGVTIQGNAGDDTITGSDNGELILVASNHGNDLITNFGENDTLRCTAGKIATVRTVGDDAVVSLKGAAYSGTVTLQGAGDYSFDWTSAYLKMKSNDAIVNTLDGVKVVGTSSADSIVNSGSGVTIQGNAGDDTITGSDNGELILVASNHGNDLITNFGENDTLRCTAGKIATVQTVDDDAVVSLKGAAYSGTVTLQGAGDYSFDWTSAYLKMKSSDAIVNTLDGVKVVGTSSADSIVNSGSGVTIQGNAGADTITGSDNGEMILVASNHGNDVITNFGLNDTLRCTAGSIAMVQSLGDDAIVSLKGAAYSGLVWLQGAGAYQFKRTSTYLTVLEGSSNVAEYYAADSVDIIDSARSADDYWFTAKEPLVEDNALDQIVQSNAALAVPEEPLIDRLNNPIAPSIVESTQVEWHRLKK